LERKKEKFGNNFKSLKGKFLKNKRKKGGGKERGSRASRARKVPPSVLMC
jgi:hypothetical protein